MALVVRRGVIAGKSDAGRLRFGVRRCRLVRVMHFWRSITHIFEGDASAGP